MSRSLKSLFLSLYVRSLDVVLRARLRRDWSAQAQQLRARQPVENYDVVVTLTSYPPRFGCLHLTLQSLLLQSHAKTKVVLWIAHQDINRLPEAVTRLTAYGLEINACDDTRSYKKLIPALTKYAHLPLVIADDDAYYWREWLDELLGAAAAGNGKEVICHRMHRIRHGADGLPLPYSQWQSESRSPEADVVHFPTGIGGVLYLPGVLPPEVLDQQAFMSLCPTGDDIWFYWMARSNGAAFRCVQSRNYIHNWRGSQAAALAINNVGNDMNDKQIRAMIERYGYFPAPDSRTAANAG